MTEESSIIEKISEKRKKEEKKEKRKQEILEKIEKWEKEGWDVSNLKEKVRENFEKGKKAFEKTKENIKELRILRKKYRSMDIIEQNLEKIEIEHKLNNPNSVDEVRELIENIKEKDELTQSNSSSKKNSQKKESKESKEEIISLDSKENWLKILEDKKRNKMLFEKLRKQLENSEELEEKLIDYLQTDSDLRENFIYYMEYWNRTVSSEDKAKYFKILDKNPDYKVIKIYSKSPFLGCLYSIALLLEEEKIGVSKSTHPHLFFKEYVEKLYGEKGKKLEEKEEENWKLYHF